MSTCRFARIIMYKAVGNYFVNGKFRPSMQLISCRHFSSSKKEEGNGDWTRDPFNDKFWCQPKVMFASAFAIAFGIAWYKKRSGPAEAEESQPFQSKLYTDSNIAHLKVFTGTGNPELSREIAAHLGTHLSRAQLGRYADGEISVKIIDEVRGDDVFIIQSVPPPTMSTDDSVMEVLLMTSALRRASVKRITVILPYMAYSRQTQTFDENQPRPIAAADVCAMLEAMGADNIVIVDAHNPRTEGFFAPETHCTNLDPQSLAVHYFINEVKVKNPVVIAADINGGERAKAFWKKLKVAGTECDFATFAVSKRSAPSRQLPGEGTKGVDLVPETEFFVGDVSGRDVIIVDDIIDSGRLCEKVSRIAHSRGAKRIFFYATHGVLSEGAMQILEKSSVIEAVLTNTVRLPFKYYSEKIQVLSVGKMLAETIKRIHDEKPLTGMTDEKIVVGSSMPA